ncbi:hypothetical protein [Haliangium sp.]|uniref:hypothetical protein n=1 Tax=Haliangium sp. TaxID=2663208 RepID=UPI003D104EC8
MNHQLSTAPTTAPRVPLAIIALAALALALTACGPAEDGPDATPPDTFTQIYQSSTFSTCSQCHAPSAPGFTDGTETAQDWSSRDAAYMSLTTGTAAGLIGNFEGCNGVPLVGDSPEESLIVAAVDENIRASFSLTNFPNCDSDAISDMSLKIGAAFSTSDVDLLKQWITDGAPNM